MPFEPTRRRAALFTGCLAHIVQDGLTATVYVLLPLLAQTFGFNYAQVGLIKAVKSIAQAVPEMVSGMMAERVGECRTLIFGLLLAGAGYCVLAWTTGPGVVVACLLLIGAGTAFQHAPASSLIVGEYGEQGRRGALGIYNSSGDVGKLIFSGLFSFAIGLGFAWQEISLVYGLLAMASVALVVLAMRVLGTGAAAPDKETAEEDTSGLGWGILDKPSFATLLGIVFLDTMVQAGILVFVAFFMLSKGLPLALATLATVILLLGGVLGKACCGFLAQRLGERTAFILVQALTAVGLVLIVIAPDWIAMALLIPLGAVAQGSTSITYGFAAEMIHPKRMARGYALLYSSSSFSSAAGPLAVGVIADAYGIGNALYAMAGISVLAAVPILFMPAARKRLASST